MYKSPAALLVDANSGTPMTYGDRNKPVSIISADTYVDCLSGRVCPWALFCGLYGVFWTSIAASYRHWSELFTDRVEYL
jgi:hypothetical protein